MFINVKGILKQIAIEYHLQFKMTISSFQEVKKKIQYLKLEIHHNQNFGKRGKSMGTSKWKELHGNAVNKDYFYVVFFSTGPLYSLSNKTEK